MEWRLALRFKEAFALPHLFLKLEMHFRRWGRAPKYYVDSTKRVVQFCNKENVSPLELCGVRKGTLHTCIQRTAPLQNFDAVHHPPLL